MNIGLHHNLSFADYVKIDAVNNSLLGKFSISPAHALAYMQGGFSGSEAMLLGSVFHSLTLEPFGFDSEYAILPEVDRRTKAGKETAAAFEKENAGKIIITSAMLETANNMVDAAMNNSIAESFISDGEKELTAIWEIKDVICKGRIDNKQPNIIIDLKTSRNARPDNFKSTVYKYNYHQQAAFYLDGIEKITGEKCDFVFVVVENNPPYGVSVHKMSKDIIDLGREEYLKNLDTFMSCLAFDAWPCYPEELYTIER